MKKKKKMRNVEDGKIFGENAANVKHKPSRVFI